MTPKNQKNNKNQKTLEQATQKLDELQVRGIHHTEKIGIIENVMNIVITIFLANLVGWSTGLVGTLLAYYTSLLITPILANKILQQRVKSFVMNNYNEMADSGKGTVQFFLYNQRYDVVWEHIDYDSETMNAVN